MNPTHCQKCSLENSCLRRVPLFASLNVEEMKTVRSLIRHSDLRAGQTLFTLGESSRELFVIRFGKLKIVRYDEQGNEIILDILKIGDYYGIDALFHEGVYQDSGVALEDLGLCRIDLKDFRVLIQKEPALALNIMEDLQKRMIQAKRLTEILFMKDTTQRVAQFLLIRYRETPSGFVMLSQEEIGSAIHLTKETVNRKIAHFQKMGWVVLEGKRRIRVVEPVKLASAKDG